MWTALFMFGSVFSGHNEIKMALNFFVQPPERSCILERRHVPLLVDIWRLSMNSRPTDPAPSIQTYPSCDVLQAYPNFGDPFLIPRHTQWARQPW